MRKAHKQVVLFALLILFTALSLTASQTKTGYAQTASKPNVLFILTDDMKASDLAHMPNTQNLQATQGVKFTKA